MMILCYSIFTFNTNIRKFGDPFQLEADYIFLSNSFKFITSFEKMEFTMKTLQHLYDLEQIFW